MKAVFGGIKLFNMTVRCLKLKKMERIIHPIEVKPLSLRKLFFKCDDVSKKY